MINTTTGMPGIRAILFVMLILAGASYPVSSQQGATGDDSQGAQVEEVKQLMEAAAGEVQSYSYSIDAETETTYTNRSGTTETVSSTKSSGAVDVPSLRAKLLISTTQEMDGEMVAAQESERYLIKDSAYESVNGRWSRYAVMDESGAISSMNEIVGQSNLTARSNLSLAGDEVVDGVDCYRLQGVPVRSAYNTFLALQALVALSNSPIALPEDLMNMSFTEMVLGTGMAENGKITITSWVSKDQHLLKKSVIETSFVITPEIMGLDQGTEDFRIETGTVETSLFREFGQEQEISLPEEAKDASLVVPQSTSGA